MADNQQLARRVASASSSYEAAELRYTELVEKKYLEGLSEQEGEEMKLLSAELSKQDESFYGPILRRKRNVS